MSSPTAESTVSRNLARTRWLKAKLAVDAYRMGDQSMEDHRVYRLMLEWRQAAAEYFGHTPDGDKNLAAWQSLCDAAANATKDVAMYPDMCGEPVV